MTMRTASLVIALLAMLCAGPARADDDADPWEDFNRAMFSFNDGLDRWVLEPVAKGYDFITPTPLEHCISNFFNNLRVPIQSVNGFLQGKPVNGASDIGRFTVNTTLGLAGFLDPATTFGLVRHEEDFGQTLGVWGVNPGPYFVIPLLGPSTVRDAGAKFVDPEWYWARYLDNDTLYWSIWGFDKVRGRANLLKAEKVIDEASLDRYSFIRDAWWQRRRNQVYDGSPPRDKEEEEPAK